MDDERSEVISVGHLLQVIRNKLWLLLLFLILGAGVAFCFAKFLLPLKYQSYTSMYVKNSTTISSDSVELNDLNVSKSLVSTYIAVLEDDTVMERLGEELLSTYGADRLSGLFPITDGQISVSALEGCLTMESVDDTEVMKITAVTTDAEISAAMCNILAELAPEFIIRVVGAGSVEQIGAAKVNTTPVSPDVRKDTLIGALIGILLAVGIIFLIDILDNTVKDTEKLT
jgi:capsular polysaccharide biosynthesis protein